MKKLIIIMAILLAGCVEKKERTEIGGNPVQHHVPLFPEVTAIQYMVATSYKGGIAMVEIKD